jgi:hypothetical protein
MAMPIPYVVIATASGTINGQTVAVGEVINIILWDGVAPWTPPDGTEVRADPTGALTIGQTTTV